MAILVGSFTDKGREWFAKVLQGVLLDPDTLVSLRNVNPAIAGTESQGNQLITDTVVTTAFSTTGMAGGVDTVASAIGGIVAATGAAISDGETFVLKDGTVTTTFEFDKNSVVGVGNVAVPITDLDTASQVAVAIAEAINGSAQSIEATFASRTTGIDFFRIGEGGFKTLPSTEKVPIAPSDRNDKNGLEAGKGVKGDLTIDPDTAPAPDQIIVPSNGGGGSPGEPVVTDADANLFFAEKILNPADFDLTLVSGVYRLEVTCKLDLAEGNETYDSQGAATPNYFEIGIFAQEGGTRFMIGYTTFPVQTKVDSIALINKVVFEI